MQSAEFAQAVTVGGLVLTAIAAALVGLGIARCCRGAEARPVDESAELSA